MNLTEHQLAVLAYVVVDPQAWADHTEATVGIPAVLLKVDKYTPAYEAALEQQAQNYKPRTVRQQEEDDATQARIAERIRRRDEAATAAKAALAKEITDTIIAELDRRL